MRFALLAVPVMALLAGCTSRSAELEKTSSSKTPHTTLSLRPGGDTTIQPDLAKVQSEDLKKIYTYIDRHFDEHVGRLQKWIRQPSISNSGEGIPESAEMVKGFFDQLGARSRAFMTSA